MLHNFVIIVDCDSGQIRLTSGTSNMEGTVEVCYYSTWGLIADADWGKQDAQVVCKQLGYIEGNYDFTILNEFSHLIGGDAVTGSIYGKPNRTIQLSNVACAGSETSLDACDSTSLTPDEGRDLYSRVNVAGVKCYPNVTTDALSQVVSKDNAVVGLGVVGVLLAVSILITLRLVLFKYIYPYQCVTMFSCVCFNNIYF